MIEILLFAVPVFLLIIILVYFFQEKLIFQTVKLDHDYPFNFNLPFNEFFIRTPDNEKLNCIHFSENENPEGLIIYFHGNANNLSRWGKYAADFTSKGYDILMLDYRGYGKSSGIPGEEALYSDARQIWNWAKSEFTYRKWIIYGRSLGAAIAAELSVTANPDLLILETPFDDLNGATGAKLIPFHLKYQFSNKDKLPKIKTKKIIFHGTRDWIVPVSSALKLRPLLGKADQMVIITGGGHRNLNSFREYHQKLNEFLNNHN